MTIDIIKISEATKKTIDKLTGVVTLHFPSGQVLKVAAPEAILLGDVVAELISRKTCVPNEIKQKIKDSFEITE
jgi:hypothetical protein